MSASLVCVLAVLSAAPAANDWQPVYTPSNDFIVAIRGQGPGFEALPPSDGSGPPPGMYAPQTGVPDGSYVAPMDPYGAPAAPYAPDPFLGQPQPDFMTYGQPNGLFGFGPRGPQPFINGFSQRYNIGYLNDQELTRGLGELGILELDGEWEYTMPTGNGSLFSVTQQFDFRDWNGLQNLSTVLGLDAPEQVYRLGWDLEWAAPLGGPWSAQVAFNPSLNTDFGGGISKDAWSWDGRGVVYYRPSPYWLYAIGAGYWDRVNDRVLPYAGVIWTPGDRWEWRFIFPEPRVSYYVGKLMGVYSTWVYARAEYHIEAYEVHLGNSIRDRVELEDWRVLFGLRKDNGWLTEIYEIGWVFGRNVAFKHGTPGFDISSGLILQGGFQF